MRTQGGTKAGPDGPAREPWEMDDGSMVTALGDRARLVLVGGRPPARQRHRTRLSHAAQLGLAPARVAAAGRAGSVSVGLGGLEAHIRQAKENPGMEPGLLD